MTTTEIPAEFNEAREIALRKKALEKKTGSSVSDEEAALLLREKERAASPLPQFERKKSEKQADPRVRAERKEALISPASSVQDLDKKITASSELARRAAEREQQQTKESIPNNAGEAAVSSNEQASTGGDFGSEVGAMASTALDETSKAVDSLVSSMSNSFKSLGSALGFEDEEGQSAGTSSADTSSFKDMKERREQLEEAKQRVERGSVGYASRVLGIDDIDPDAPPAIERDDESGNMGGSAELAPLTPPDTPDIETKQHSRSRLAGVPSLDKSLDALRSRQRELAQSSSSSAEIDGFGDDADRKMAEDLLRKRNKDPLEHVPPDTLQRADLVVNFLVAASKGRADQGWTDVSRSLPGAIVSKLRANQGDIHGIQCTRVQGAVDATPRDLLPLLSTSATDSPPEWDEYYLHGRKMCEIDEEHDLISAQYRMPYPFDDREFVCIEARRTLDDGSVVVAWFSIPYDAIPAAEGRVRGQIYSSGWVIRPVNDETSVATYVMQVDPQGNIPKFVTNLDKIGSIVCEMKYDSVKKHVIRLRKQRAAATSTLA